MATGLGGSQGFGEQLFDRNDDSSLGPIDITSVFGAAGLDFFGTTYTSLFLNNNGNITFNSPFGGYTPSSISAGIGNPLIAAFWTDIDTRNAAGQTSAGGTSQGTNQVYYDLDAVNGVLTFTWDDVGQYFNGTAPNAFQIQLISRGDGDFDIIYRYEDITWGGDARAGYNSGTGTSFEFAQSGTAAMLDLEGTAGNTGIAGVYVFNVRDGVVSTANEDILNGGEGMDRLIGGLGDDTFVFDAGQANGDVIADFIGNGAAAGDTLVFNGYGTAAEGATFIQLDSTHWQITSADGQIQEIITLENGAVINAGDYEFVGSTPAPEGIQRSWSKDPGSADRGSDNVGAPPSNDPDVLPAADDAFVMPLPGHLDDGRLVLPGAQFDDGLTWLFERPGEIALLLANDPLVVQGPQGPHVLLPDDVFDGHPAWNLLG